MEKLDFIPFNKPLLVGDEMHRLEDVISRGKFSGDGSFTHSCQEILEEVTGTKKSLLTTSCTDALELSALAIGIQNGDEVIMPSYTFVSTANAFALRGARIKFVDVDPSTMNISPDEIEKAISKKTKAIVIVHYAGVSCDMTRIKELAKNANCFLIEDAAQCIEAYHDDGHLGALGDFGTLSFHETKNLHCGEGGAILINNTDYLNSCEIIREKGTNRAEFLRGQVDKYSWRSLGSSFLPNEFSAGVLFSQLSIAKKMTQKRLELWNHYHKSLKELKDKERLGLPYIPGYATHNAHMYYIKTRNLDERTRLSQFLKERAIASAFHYVPLHSSEIGKELGEFCGEDKYTTAESERLLRLPLFFDLSLEEVERISDCVKEFYRN